MVPLGARLRASDPCPEPLRPRPSGSSSGSCRRFAHLPELPGRAPGADLIGRSAALLVDVAVDLTPAGWRLRPAPGRATSGGPRSSCSATSTPCTRSPAATPARSRCRPPGRGRSPPGSSAPAATGRVVDAGRPPRPRPVPRRGDRGPRRRRGRAGCRVPSRGAAGRAVGAGGAAGRPADRERLREAGGGRGERRSSRSLPSWSARIGVPVVVHCCAPERRWTSSAPPGPPRSPSTWASCRTSTPSARRSRPAPSCFPGVVPVLDAPLRAPKATASRVQAWWRELGFSADQLADAVTLTPACGLAGATPATPEPP